MPRGPKGEKRPADVNARAVMIAKIATGEIEDVRPTPESEGKNPAAVARGASAGKRERLVCRPVSAKKYRKRPQQKRWQRD